MLIRTLHVLDRLQHRRSRADELAALRRRLVAVGKLSSIETQLAAELRHLRETIIATMGHPQACKECARNLPLPNGRWDGGFCCGSSTEELFTDEEIATLRSSGTRAVSFKAPRSDHSGCVFRGPRGCSLHGRHRPNICVRYFCRDLLHELKARGVLTVIESLCAELDRKYELFAALRIERLKSVPLESELLGRELLESKPRFC